jgi:hypothetical protein
MQVFLTGATGLLGLPPRHVSAIDPAQFDARVICRFLRGAYCLSAGRPWWILPSLRPFT